MTCDDYQIALEQQLADVPAAISLAQVEAHVAGCAVCAEYREVSLAVSLFMDRSLGQSPSPVSVGEMKAIVSRERTRAHRGLVLTPALFALLMFATSMLEGKPSAQSALASVILGVFMAIFGARFRRKRLAHLASLEENSDTLRFRLREELEGQMRAARFLSTWFAGAVLVAIYFLFDVSLLPWSASLVYAAATLGLAVWAGVNWARLRRELALLDD